VKHPTVTVASKSFDVELLATDGIVCADE